MEGLLTTEQACERAGVKDRTLRAWAASGRLERIRGRDGRTYYRPEDVDRAAQALPAEGRTAGAPALSSPAAPVPAAPQWLLLQRRVAYLEWQQQQAEAKHRGAERAAGELARRLEDARGEIDFLRARLEAEQRAAAELRVLLQTEQKRALTAPAGDFAGMLPPAAEPGPKRRRWWSLWRRE